MKPRERDPSHRRVKKVAVGAPLECRLLNGLCQQGAMSTEELAELFHVGVQYARQMRSGNATVKQVHLDLLDLHLGNRMPLWLKRMGVDSKEQLGFSEGL